MSRLSLKHLDEKFVLPFFAKARSLSNRWKVSQEISLKNWYKATCKDNRHRETCEEKKIN